MRVHQPSAPDSRAVPESAAAGSDTTPGDPGRSCVTGVTASRVQIDGRKIKDLCGAPGWQAAGSGCHGGVPADKKSAATPMKSRLLAGQGAIAL